MNTPPVPASPLRTHDPAWYRDRLALPAGRPRAAR